MRLRFLTTVFFVLIAFIPTAHADNTPAEVSRDFGQHTRRLDVAVSEAGQSGIMPEGTLKLKVHKDAKLTDFPVEGGRGTEFSARSKCIEKRPEIHEYSESSNVMGSLLRAFTATMGLVQEVEQLAEHLAPEPEPLQRELYQALEEEGVEPTASMEILADPEVREVVEEVQQYVDRQILRQQKGKGRAAEPVVSSSVSSSSAAAAASAVQSLDTHDPSQILDAIAMRAQQGMQKRSPEGSALQRRVEAVLGKFKHSDLVEQAQRLGDALDRYGWAVDMAIDMGIDIANLYGLGAGSLLSVATKAALGATRGGSRLAPRPGERKIIDETAQARGNPTELGSYSEAPEFGGSVPPPSYPEATGCKGQRAFELENPVFQPARNTEAVIGGRRYTGHALDQMQNRGFTPSVVEDIIARGQEFPDPMPGRAQHYDSESKIKVITEGKDVITVFYSRPIK